MNELSIFYCPIFLLIFYIYKTHKKTALFYILIR